MRDQSITDETALQTARKLTKDLRAKGYCIVNEHDHISLSDLSSNSWECNHYRTLYFEMPTNRNGLTVR